MNFLTSWMSCFKLTEQSVFAGGLHRLQVLTAEIEIILLELQLIAQVGTQQQSQPQSEPSHPPLPPEATQVPPVVAGEKTNTAAVSSSDSNGVASRI